MNSLIITKCPYCGSELSFDGIHLMCNNEECPGRLKASLQSTLSVLEIGNLGPAMINEMVDNGLSNPYQLLENTFIDTLYHNGLKHTVNTDKVKDALSKISSIELYKVILLMGIDGLGKSTAVQIANKVAGVTYSYSGLEKDIVSKFEDGQDNLTKLNDIISYLNSKSIDVIYPKEDNSIGVEFTGSPKPLFNTKDDFLKFIEKSGYSHVKLAKAKYLITDSYDSSSSKMSEAKKKGIEILTYNDFVEKVNYGKTI